MEHELLDPALNILQPTPIDESITDLRHTVFYPQSGNRLDQGQITIIVENQSAYFLPSKSFLILKGNLIVGEVPIHVRIEPDEDEQQATLVNNAPMYLFRNIEYSLGNKTIESINNPGHASLMKGLLSYTPADGDNLNMGWFNDDMVDYSDADTPNTNSGYKERFIKYNELDHGRVAFLIPLSHIFGFCEDYKKIIFGIQHRFTFSRQGIENAIIRYGPPGVLTFELTDLQLSMATIQPNLEAERTLNQTYASPSTKIPIVYRARQLQELTVPQSTIFTWKLGSIIKPRYFIIGFQTDRRDNYRNAAIFDHCNLKNIHVELNGIKYPKTDFITDFETGDYVWHYYFNEQFRQSYYQTRTHDDFMIKSEQYKKFYPLFVFDVSRQDEKIRNASLDTTIKAEFRHIVPQPTYCYCLVISEKILSMTTDGLISEM